MIIKLKQSLDIAMSDPQGNENLISSLNFSLLSAYKAEEEFWRQQSRIMWLSSEDNKFGYFHDVAKGRRARNRMTVIEGSDGTTYFEEEQIAGQILAYFTDIFSSAANLNTTANTREIVEFSIMPTVSDVANEKITWIPDAAEIKHALFLIHPDKAPGPDGFSASFFHSNWSTIGSALISEVQSFFRTGCLPPVTNITYVRLIPKITAAKQVWIIDQ